MTTTTGCGRDTRITRSLLGFGVIAGPIYVLISVGQAISRQGFDLSRHAWSLLSNGDLGWIQIANFIAAGLMVAAFAIGLRRALGTGRGATWAPRLVGVFGASLVAAGLFRADPALGFPPGTPPDAAEISWHGLLHFACGAVGFAGLVAAGFVLASRFAAEGRVRWAGYSRLTGTLCGLGFVAVAAGGGAAWANLAFVVGVVLVWIWVSAAATHLYQGIGRPAERAVSR